MPDDIFERAQAVLDKFASAQDRHEHLSGQIENEKLLKQSATERHKKCLEDIEELVVAVETLKQAIVPLTERGLQRLRDLVSHGLLTIFFDEKYSVDIEIKERGSDKSAVFWLLEQTEDGTKRCQLRDSVGGGVKAVVSLILRVFFIIHYKQRRIVVLDEPWGDVAEEYIPGLFQFLQYTVDDLGFRYLIVTHDPRFLPYADRIYKVTKGKVELTKEGMRETEDGYAA